MKGHFFRFSSLNVVQVNQKSLSLSMWFLFKMNVTMQETIFHQEWRKCYIQQGGECLLSNGWNNITTLEETKQFRWREKPAKTDIQVTKACKPRRVIAYRGSFVSDDAKTTNETSLSIQYLCCECLSKYMYLPYRKYMYPIGNTCTLMETYITFWKYMYPIGNTCTPLEIHVPYWQYMYHIGNICTLWKIPAFGTMPVEPQD